jgi:hypothetical protein
MNQNGCRLLLLCLLGVFSGCGNGDERGVEPAPAKAVPPGVNLNAVEVTLPLRARGVAGAPEIQGRAVLGRLQVGAGKRGGGLMKVLSPAIRVEGADLVTEGEDLRLLSDLPKAIQTLIKLDALEIRGLRVRDPQGVVLLECGGASVVKDEAWELREVRLSGGPLQGRVHLHFDESGAPQMTGGR